MDKYTRNKIFMQISIAIILITLVVQIYIQFFVPQLVIEFVDTDKTFLVGEKIQVDILVDNKSGQVLKANPAIYSADKIGGPKLSNIGSEGIDDCDPPVTVYKLCKWQNISSGQRTVPAIQFTSEQTIEWEPGEYKIELYVEYRSKPFYIPQTAHASTTVKVDSALEKTDLIE